MAYLSPLDDHYWKCQSFCNKASQKKKKNSSDDYEDFLKNLHLIKNKDLSCYLCLNTIKDDLLDPKILALI